VTVVVKLQAGFLAQYRWLLTSCLLCSVCFIVLNSAVQDGVLQTGDQSAGSPVRPEDCQQTRPERDGVSWRARGAGYRADLPERSQ
jgi:hypothetical protein